MEVFGNVIVYYFGVCESFVLRKERGEGKERGSEFWRE